MSKALFAIAFMVICTPLWAQTTDEIPNEVIAVKPGKAYTVGDDGSHVLVGIQFTTKDNNASLLDGTSDFDFCGKKARASLDAKVLMIDENLLTFGEDGIKGIERLTTDMPLWLAAGTKICVPSSHRTVQATLLRYDASPGE